MPTPVSVAFTSEQNGVLLAIGQYVQAFSHLDMAVTFAIVERIAGNAEASLIVLRNMDFRTRCERCFRIGAQISAVPSQIIEDLRIRIENENKFRNVLLHSTVGIEPNGKAFLNAWGKGFGQANNIASHIGLDGIQNNVQRCWRLFQEFDFAFSPGAMTGFISAMESALTKS